MLNFAQRSQSTGDVETCVCSNLHPTLLSLSDIVWEVAEACFSSISAIDVYKRKFININQKRCINKLGIPQKDDKFEC